MRKIIFKQLTLLIITTILIYFKIKNEMVGLEELLNYYEITQAEAYLISANMIKIIITAYIFLYIAVNLLGTAIIVYFTTENKRLKKMLNIYLPIAILISIIIFYTTYNFSNYTEFINGFYYIVGIYSLLLAILSSTSVKKYLRYNRDNNIW